MPQEPRIIELPPSWEAARVEDGSEGLALHRTSHRDLARLAREPGWVHYAGLTERPGVTLWTTRLELTYFPPRTDRNRSFRLHFVAWEGLGWTVVSIPWKSRRFASRVAEQVGLRVADGVPTVITPAGYRLFPMDTANVFHPPRRPGRR